MAINRIQSMGLRTKILMGYGLVLILIALVCAWAIMNLLQLGRATEGILSENYRSIIAAENMIDALERQDSGVLLYILGFEDEGTRQFQENERKFLQWFARAHDNITIDGEAAIIDEIETTYTEYLAFFSDFIQTSAASGEKPATQYHDVLLPAFMQVRQASAELRDLNQLTMYEASETAQDVAVRAVWSTSLVSLLAIVLALILSLMLTSRLVRPLRRMQEAARQIAAGEYDVAVPTGREDELGQLARQFNEMASRLQAYRAMNVEQIVSEKRKSEAIIRSIDDGLLAVDADMRIVNVNPAAVDILGLDANEVTGRSFDEVVRDDGLVALMRRVVTEKRAPDPEGDTIVNIERGQDTHYFQYSVAPVDASGDALRGAILVLRDVTKLKEVDRLKSEFVATASHELKTPLTSIGMSIGLLRERLSASLGDRERDLLEVAGEEVQRLRGIVKDLLDLSKIEAGRIEMEMDAVPASLLFEKAAYALRGQAEEHSIELTWQADNDLPRVRADPNKITWVLTNLISNAFRYTEPGGHVRLAAKHVGSKVHVSVEDDGAGIPYSFQPKIFEKFVQVKDETGSSVEGSGLGLAICKEIVRAHGGTIWVESVPGTGSTFTFTLPAAS